MRFDEAMTFMRYGYTLCRKDWEDETKIIYMDDFDKIAESKLTHEDKYISAYWPDQEDINADDWKVSGLKTEWRSE